MRTTVEIDDALLEEAQKVAPRSLTKRELVNEALRAFIERQAALDLATAGGKVPDAWAASRRRF